MAGQEKVLGKSKLGRPAIGRVVQINSSFRPEDVAALDRWIADQAEPQPGRPEAIRFLLRDSLTGLGYLPHRDDPEMVN